jgi:cellulose synthase/poly-beta-1,6-N-acetylglucosamine synthase-like glycosyltransferase
MAKGQILAFTDADCLPYDNWMEEGVRCITGSDDCGLVAGKIEITFSGNNNPTAVELFEKLTAFDQEKSVKRWHFGATANVFTKREVIEKVGMLDGSLKSGADFEWGRRVYQAGYGQVYCDKAVVRHPARRTIRQIIDKHRRVAGGLSDIRSKETDYTLKRFLVDLKDDWPGGADFGNIFSRDTLKAAQKIRVAAIMALVKAARIFEMIRLKIGGSSRRI